MFIFYISVGWRDEFSAKHIFYTFQCSCYLTYRKEDLERNPLEAIQALKLFVAYNNQTNGGLKLLNHDEESEAIDQALGKLSVNQFDRIILTFAFLEV